jgi:hypothetical protein
MVTEQPGILVSGMAPTAPAFTADAADPVQTLSTNAGFRQVAAYGVGRSLVARVTSF